MTQEQYLSYQKKYQSLVAWHKFYEETGQESKMKKCLRQLLKAKLAYDQAKRIRAGN